MDISPNMPSIAPRPFIDAVAFQERVVFHGPFLGASLDTVVDRVLSAVDSNKDGFIARQEARRVEVFDPEAHVERFPNSFMSRATAVRAVYDATGLLDADLRRDGLVDRTELLAFLARRVVGDATAELRTGSIDFSTPQPTSIEISPGRIINPW